jgi:hypothetical protein
MVSRDLNDILEILYQAGAYRVPAEDIAWSVDQAPAVFRALNMSYIRKIPTRSGNRFSLTRAGYEAIDREVPCDKIFRHMIRSCVYFWKTQD